MNTGLIEAKKRIEEARQKKSDSLSLNNLELPKIPDELFTLSEITRLYLSNNKLKEIPKEISKLPKLVLLDLYSNELNELPEELSDLEKLITLDLSRNAFHEIPNSIEKLKNLRLLFLSENEIFNVPVWISKLTKLNLLDVSNNKLEELPGSLKDFNRLVNLELEGNEFEWAIEIYSLPTNEKVLEILKWQEAKKAELLKPINEAKVIFIGESNYGKTHLIELLAEGQIKREIKTTHGIERRNIFLKNEEREIRLNIWDLGGQQFMRNTHQFFFSERTLYVLVTLARTEKKDLNHWLKMVRKLGKSAPVLIVVNKIDLDPHYLDRKSLQRDYKNIVGFVRTTIKGSKEFTSEESTKNLYHKIKEVVTDKHLMPSVYETRRPEWFLVKKELEKLEEKNIDFITYEEYENLGYIKNLSQNEKKRNLELFSILGTVVSYINDLRLIDTNVINPQWIMDGVYAIINDTIIKDKMKGKLHLRELERILTKKRFPKSKHRFLLDLMEKFNVCYRSTVDKNLFFIPDLFEDIEPEYLWEEELAMKFRYTYDDYAPDTFMTQFIVEMNHDIILEKRWRSGVYIFNGKCRAKVYQGFRRNIINIEIIGEKNNRRGYLYSIMEVFRKLHESFSSEIEINPEVFYKGHWVNYLDLEIHERENKPFFHTKLKEDLPVTDILNGYSERRLRNEDEIDKKIDELISLVQLSLTRTTVLHYPNIFTIKPKKLTIESESVINDLYELQLYCASPKCIHPVGAPYEIEISKKWVNDMAPYINGILSLLKIAAPLVSQIDYEFLGEASYKPEGYTLNTMREYLKKLNPIPIKNDIRKGEGNTPEKVSEADMQNVKYLLDKVDTSKKWMKYLQKVNYKGEIIWVCPHHAKEF